MAYILYDLTNTYLTGKPSKSRNARLGRSKEKRYGGSVPKVVEK